MIFSLKGDAEKSEQSSLEERLTRDNGDDLNYRFCIHRYSLI